jgi:hypothetical protein
MDTLQKYPWIKHFIILCKEYWELLPESKVTEAWSYQLISNKCKGLQQMKLFAHVPDTMQVASLSKYLVKSESPTGDQGSYM